MGLTLKEIRDTLRVGKNHKDAKGHFKYRNLGDIFSAIKKLDIDDTFETWTEMIDTQHGIIIVGNAQYQDVVKKSYVVYDLAPKQMSLGQAGGASYSYAVKYAICDLNTDCTQDINATRKRKSYRLHISTLNNYDIVVLLYRPSQDLQHLH